jgi:AcrR family transcriptional regulator
MAGIVRADARLGSRFTSRLSVDDWIEAGLELLAEEGPGGVKIDRLCVRLGVTKGSFYWHFTDLAAFFKAMAARWGALRDERRVVYAQLEELEPRERLSRMLDEFADPRDRGLERAARDWARTDATVHERVVESDRWVFRAVRQVFADLGFDAADAEARARMLRYAGVGLIYVGEQGQRGGRRQRERMLDVLTK